MDGRRAVLQQHVGVGLARPRDAVIDELRHLYLIAFEPGADAGVASHRDSDVAERLRGSDARRLRRAVRRSLTVTVVSRRSRDVR